MDKETIISIIIPTLREGNYLERTLKNFDGFTLPHEIIITDGGSTDGTLDIARRYTDKIMVWNEPRRQTFGEAKNVGAALARGQYFVFIDADVIVPNPNHFFAEMIAFFERKSELVASTVPLKVLADYARFGDRFFMEPLNIWYILANNIFHFGNASGEFQMIRADAFARVKGYSEHLVMGEDTDMFIRLSKIGRTFSYTKLAVYHSCRRPHKVGWLRIYGIWIKGGLSLVLRGKAAYKEWKVIR